MVLGMFSACVLYGYVRSEHLFNDEIDFWRERAEENLSECSDFSPAKAADQLRKLEAGRGEILLSGTVKRAIYAFVVLYVATTLLGGFIAEFSGVDIGPSCWWDGPRRVCE